MTSMPLTRHRSRWQDAGRSQMENLAAAGAHDAGATVGVELYGSVAIRAQDGYPS